MHDGKWIDGLTAAMPVAEAARRVLAARLAVVHRCLPAALERANEDAEHVHQLRVATRRARAALDIFAPCLSEDACAAGRKQLRKIRRAAGAARDWDVFLASLTSPTPRWPAKHAAGRDLLIGYALAQRGIGQQKLLDLGADYPHQFEQWQARMLGAIAAKRAQPSLIDLAQELLTELVLKVERGLAGDLADYDRLHQVRIDGKRLRYAMEVFAGCLAPALRERVYPIVEEMQEILGDANDSHGAIGRLQDVLALLVHAPPPVARRCRPGIIAWQQHHEERLQEQRRRLARWQQRWQKATPLKAVQSSPG